jgi:hypothetical protein
MRVRVNLRRGQPSGAEQRHSRSQIDAVVLRGEACDCRREVQVETREARTAPWWSASAIRVLGCHRRRRHGSSTPSSRPRNEGSDSVCPSAGRSSRRTAEDFGHGRTTSTEQRSRLSCLLRLRADSRLAFLCHRKAKVHGTSAFGTFCRLGRKDPSNHPERVVALQATAVAARERVDLVLSHLHPRCGTEPHAAGFGAGSNDGVLSRDRDSW